ncbi:MAG: ABC transporter permease [Lachnospiraceae bacterium]|nr:ABC transporter permease [Lachnospiraceae bacterium]
MLFGVLKREMKRKKTMNIIILLFVVLATMFVASGVNNVITVMNGTDYYLDKANVGDYVIITTSDDKDGSLQRMLETESAVKGYRMERVIYAAHKNISDKDGNELDCKNTLILQSIDESAINFFDKDNNKIESIEKGHIYVAGSFMKKNDLNEGDVIRINHSGVEMTFILDGMAKDALLGSDFMGNTRIILNDEDMEQLRENEMIYNEYQGRICYVDTDDVRAVATAVNQVSNVTFADGRSLIKMCYVMELIVAFIMLILSVCLIIVAVVVLKFSITFTISEEFREIGVMKAIGITNRKIRRLYITKYMLLSVIGAGIGFVGSIPFGNMLLKSVSENMVLGNDSALLINILSVPLVIGIIILFAYLCTAKIKKMSPIDAIRSGQTGERYKKKTVCRIGNSGRMGTAFFMGLNDILSSPRRFVTIIISFCICTLFVLIMVNTTATMKSDKLIYTFGTKSDLYVMDVSDAMEQMGSNTKEGMKQSLDEKADELAGLGMPAEFKAEIQYKYQAFFEGNGFTFTCQQGLNMQMSDYLFTEGVPPQNKYEIAITPQISELTGAKIGDVITINFGEETIECMVTAYFENMNSLGKTVRLHEDAPTDFKYISTILPYQIDFTDNPSEEEVELRKERIKEFYDSEEIMNAAEYCEYCVAVADTMVSVQFLLLAITLIVVLMVTMLMERTFITNEKSQIAILKAIGFKNSVIIKWQVCRFGMVALAAGILAACLSIPMTEICITPIFGMMGATNIDYKIEPLNIFLLYPGIVFAVTVAVAWITAAICTRTIKSSDTANIE